MLRCTRLLPRQRIARHVRYITSEELSERERLRADMQRLGLSDPVEVEIKYADPYGKHRQQVRLADVDVSLVPNVENDAFVAPCATLIGNVELWTRSSVWYGATIKADVKLVRIGAYTNVQDKTFIGEAVGPLDADHDGSTVIGHLVTIGHKCVLRACTIEDKCLIGMGSVLEEGSYVERNSILGAGSVLPAGTRVPSGELWLGNPAKFVRKLTAEEIQRIDVSARKYAEFGQEHADAIYGSGGHGTAYLEAEKRGLQVGALEWPAVPAEVPSQFKWK